MTTAERIGVFFNKGRNLTDVLRAVRKEHPAAHICAIVPKSYSATEQELALVQETAYVERARYGLGDMGGFVRLIGQIRKQRYDVFVIMFDTPKVRLLGAVSGARAVWYCRLDGRLVPISKSILGILGSVIARRTVGGVVYGGAWLAVRLLKTRTTTDEH